MFIAHDQSKPLTSNTNTSQVLKKGRTDSRALPVPRSSGLKTLALSVGRRSHASIARQVMLNPKTRVNVLAMLRKDLQKELKTLTAKRTNSCLRQRSVLALRSFSWAKLEEEVERNAPTLHNVLKGLTTVTRLERSQKKGRKRKRRSYHASNSAVFGLCVAVLLRHCNHSMSLVQRIISVILHSGHAGKQVHLCCINDYALYVYMYIHVHVHI